MVKTFITNLRASGSDTYEVTIPIDIIRFLKLEVGNKLELEIKEVVKNERV